MLCEPKATGFDGLDDRSRRRRGLWSARLNQIGLFAQALMPVRPNRCPGDRCLWRNSQDLPMLAIPGQPLPPRREIALRLEVVTKR
jgi:hypothetical protein